MQVHGGEAIADGSKGPATEKRLPQVLGQHHQKSTDCNLGLLPDAKMLQTPFQMPWLQHRCSTRMQNAGCWEDWLSAVPVFSLTKGLEPSKVQRMWHGYARSARYNTDTPAIFHNLIPILIFSVLAFEQKRSQL